MVERDHVPFGSLLPGRNYSSSDYRFGWNGKEKDDEVHNAAGTSLDFGDRMYDPRVGRWLCVDPLAHEYVPISPYAFSLNNPISLRDADGRVVVDANGNPVTISITKAENGTATASYTFAEGTSQAVMDQFNANAGVIIGAMLTTPTGTEAVEFWRDYHKNVNLTLSQDVNESAYATTYEDARNVYTTVYLGSITQNSEGDRWEVDPSDPRLSYDLTESLGGVATHERWHLDKKQKWLDFWKSGDNRQNPAKNKPVNAEIKFKTEYRKMLYQDGCCEGEEFDPSMYNERGYYGMDENYQVKPAPQPADGTTP